MKLKANAALAIPYDVPESGVMQVRVASSEPINVFAIQREALERYKKREDFPAFGASSVTREHEFLVRLPAGSPWNLIVENPWEREVEVNYAVTELAPVTISGSFVAGPARVSATMNVRGAPVTGSGTGTVNAREEVPQLILEEVQLTPGGPLLKGTRLQDPPRQKPTPQASEGAQEKPRPKMGTTRSGS